MVVSSNVRSQDPPRAAEAPNRRGWIYLLNTYVGTPGYL